MREDLGVVYKKKCAKANAPYVFVNATSDFYVCLETYLQDGNVDDTQSVIDEWVSDFILIKDKVKFKKLSFHLFTRACRDPSVPTKCMETWKSKISRCLNADEMETLYSVQRIMEKILSLNCKDSGRYFVSIMSGEGNQCIRTRIDSIGRCSKEFKQIVFPLQEDTLQFRLQIGIRK